MVFAASQEQALGSRGRAGAFPPGSTALGAWKRIAGDTMKTRNLGISAAAVCAMMSLTALGQIANSRHNFSSYGWSGGEICKPCYTPHNANTDVGFLWNHALSNATYTMHEGTGTAEANIDSRSRMCMGCHRGVWALEAPVAALAGRGGARADGARPRGARAVHVASGCGSGAGAGQQHL